MKTDFDNGEIPLNQRYPQLYEYQEINVLKFPDYLKRIIIEMSVKKESLGK